MAGTLRPSTESVLAIPGLSGSSRLVHGFSTASLGSMRGTGTSALTPSRAAFAAALGLPPEHLTVVGAVHGRRVERVDGPSGVVPGCDALVTDRPGLPLLATFADCNPVLLLDPVRGALGLAHAGWRGAAAGVVGETVARLGEEYGSRPADLLVGLGPAICGRCYEVGEEVAAVFPPEYAVPGRQGRFLLDLRSALHGQLAAAGVPEGQIYDLDVCTKETPELASHRRSPDGVRFACLAALT
ncbi:MAG: laccase [Candidatus Nephthysia bennettiae]|uniref:Laccase domain-containing protein n=1 Tax=Candidatus Nephthysia bennettiae TaxID=3127016 RepID=A0A934KCT8_9BACT|nr:laccase domain-containing protein [Candidatus Dormibacteraeota bacterium]MBJ7611350.1 laccase domain-containing protein [Candidatus Dormibacteraeota bacterium]PZR92721.1 MAG: laccase [Candidatus Dormibacteraeota bacterium]